MSLVYPLASSSWDQNEKDAAIEVINSGMCTMGKLTTQFEEKFAKLVGSKYAVMSNSGSSANLLMVAALRYHSKYKLLPGDEVIIPAVSWSTSYYPFHQYGIKIKLVDINIDSLNISLKELVKAIGPKTKAILAVNLLGNPCDFTTLQQICDEHNLLLLEDNCESQGASFGGKQCGTFGIAGSYSTFFSHITCSIEGGITVTDDLELYELMVSLRAHGWLRGLPNENTVCNKTGDEFEDLFRFVLPGYNVRPNDVFAAIGLHQLDKLPKLVLNRQKNANYFYKTIGKIPDIKLQYVDELARSCYFGFSMVFMGKYKDHRKDIVAELMKNNIQCRPIVAGNFALNPVMRHMDVEVVGKLPTANFIHKNGLFVGNSHLDLTEQIDLLYKVLSNI